MTFTMPDVRNLDEAAAATAYRAALDDAGVDPSTLTVSAFPAVESYPTDINGTIDTITGGTTWTIFDPTATGALGGSLTVDVQAGSAPASWIAKLDTVTVGTGGATTEFSYDVPLRTAAGAHTVVLQSLDGGGTPIETITVDFTITSTTFDGWDDNDHLGESSNYAGTVGADGSVSWQDPEPGNTDAPGGMSVDVWGVSDSAPDVAGALSLEVSASLYATATEFRLYASPAVSGDYGPTRPATPAAFTTRWSSALHVGDKAPRMVIEVRRGRWSRDYRTVSGDQILAATIHGETDVKPWLAWWIPAEDWLEIPGVAEYSEQQAFTENGCQVATLTMDNVRFTEQTGIDELPYREIERGFAAPTRGYAPAGRDDDGLEQTEWYDRLARMAQVRVWQGYGDPERTDPVDGSTMPADGGTNGLWVFSGQIDDLDLSDAPDHITITCRNGQPLTDQEFFGWNKSKQLVEPVVFADRTEAADNPAAARWILVDDVSDIVRVILRWAGYRDLSVESTGIRMKGHKGYNRQNRLVDPINDICEQTGYSFFMAPPLDGSRLALPVFRLNGARDDAPDPMTEVDEDDLLTGLEYKQSMEPLAYIVRCRGKDTSAVSGGVTLGGDPSIRIMAEYRPPWSHQPGDPDLLEDRLGGLLKHVTFTRPQLRTAAECLAACKLLAFAEAVAEVQAVVEIPGHPGLCLDDQVGVTDTGSAVNSRLWVAERSNTFTTGEQTSWKTTLTGPLLDFPDVAAMLTDMEGLEP